MKSKVTESMSAAQSTALGMLVEYKEFNVGARMAEHDRLVDQRFIVAVTALLKTREEKEVMPWLMNPCRCLDCQSLEIPSAEAYMPRIDMLNAEVSFRHLMEQINCEGFCLP